MIELKQIEEIRRAELLNQSLKLQSDGKGQENLSYIQMKLIEKD